MPTRHTAGHPSKLSLADPEPGDEQDGGFSREALLKMDQRFCAAMERAIARGLERPNGLSAGQRKNPARAA